PTLAALSSSFEPRASAAPAPEILTDDGARERFKAEAHGIRRDLGGLPRIPIGSATSSQEYTARRTHRRYKTELVTARSLGDLLTSLSEVSVDGKPKRRYASAGGLYPVQVYVHIKPGRVEGLAHGLYYFDPAAGALVLVAPGAEIGGEIHEPFLNRGIFERAAFSIFLVLRLAAIAPIYGEHSIRFATLETGMMTQLLEETAARLQLGLCQIGSLNFDDIRPWFRLDDGDELLHSLVGGTALEQPEAGDVKLERYGRKDHAAGKTTTELRALAASDIDRLPLPAARALEHTRRFLTGATGFLGAWLLRELLRRSDCEVACLVRASDRNSGLERIRRNLSDYGLWESRFEHRILPEPGDLALPLLGLGEDRFNAIAGSCSAIYHSGALVNFLYGYAQLEAPNVAGTREILRLALRGRLKPLHYISTVAVFPLWSEGPRLRYMEESPLDHGEPLYGGYSQTKWVAERMVASARARGLPVTIYRPAGVAGHSISGACDTSSFLSLALRSYIEMGAAPDIDFDICAVPVDYAASAVAYLAGRTESEGRTYHLLAAKPLGLDHLVEIAGRLGYPLHRVAYPEWLRMLRASAASGREVALSPFLALFDGEDSGRGSSTWFDCFETASALGGSGIACPAFDEELLRTYFGYFRTKGLVP
ncbi:MAG: thioester reductase domain-containing protein, partial [Acidobacteriia bacterium]|nr:thioester reductase domain-containing protein [Terriglobia bacterium]